MIIAVAGGLIIGMLVGALGGGGAILGVPLLVYGAGQDSQQATLSSLVIVVSAALAGLVMQHRNGAVNYRTGLIFGVLGSVGALAGTLLNGKISDLERRITQREQKVKTLEEYREVSSRVHGALGDKTDDLERRVSALQG